MNEGAWLIAWGLYKKMVVADNMAALVNSVFGPFDHLERRRWPCRSDGLRVLFGVYAFAFQIYGDFSGYTDIARGTARLLGFNIMLNFDLPYFATSPSSFWRRWHISLSTWLRDYLYISLGGNRGGTTAVYRNLMLTMLLGGLWHGASWTFVLWGFYHGALLVAYRAAGVRTEQGELPALGPVPDGRADVPPHLPGLALLPRQNLTTVSVFLQSILLHPHGSPEAYALLRRHRLLRLVPRRLRRPPGPDRGRPAPADGALELGVRLNVWMLVFVSIAALTPQTPTTFIYFAF